jgi:hypothetical protein
MCLIEDCLDARTSLIYAPSLLLQTQAQTQPMELASQDNRRSSVLQGLVTHDTRALKPDRAFRESLSGIVCTSPRFAGKTTPKGYVADWYHVYVIVGWCVIRRTILTILGMRTVLGPK